MAGLSRSQLMHGMSIWIGGTAICWLAVAGPAAAQSQIPYLVKDISPGFSLAPPPTTAATGFFTLGGKLLFGSGEGLWSSDGSAEGTVQIAQLSSCANCPLVVLGSAGGRTYLIQGNAVWITDGTVGGTQQLAVAPNINASFVALLGGKLFFNGCLGSNCGVLASDGTVAGTAVIAPTAVGQMASSGGHLFFLVNLSQSFLGPIDLWMSDGTAAGTHVLVHFPVFQILADVAAVSHGVVFVANDGLTQQVWGSDGTAAGTKALTHFTDGEVQFPNLFLKAIEGTAYLELRDSTNVSQLWRSDGTVAGTAQATNIQSPKSLTVAMASQVEGVGGHVVFFASDSAGSEAWVLGNAPGQERPLCSSACAAQTPSTLVGAEGRLFWVSLNTNLGSATLWETDGTVAGTAPLVSDCASGCSGLNLNPVSLGGRVYFNVGSAGGQSFQLWSSDGTLAGTGQISTRTADFGSAFNPFSSAASLLGALDGLVFFTAPDGNGIDQLWANPGNPTGERQLTDSVFPNSSNPQNLTAAESHLFFTAQTSPSSFLSLWQTDGTPAGTLPVPNLPQSFLFSFSPGGLTASGSHVYFFADDAQQTSQLWVADGGPAGAKQLTHFTAGIGIGPVAPAPNERAVFMTTTFVGRQATLSIWESDGTIGGTTHLFDLPPAIGTITTMSAIGSSLYIAALTQQTASIWKSDFTAASTVRLVSFQSGIGSADPNFTASGAKVVFSGIAPFATLLATDGTPTGTGPVVPGSGAPDSPFSLTAAGSRVFMLDRTSHLWVSDGTAGGTMQVSTDCCIQRDLVALGDHVFFHGANGATRFSLFMSDGTAAGTAPVIDPNGLPAVTSTPLVVAAGKVFFTADDGQHGVELWQTDGTSVGTRMVDDLAPGAASSSPTTMTPVGDLLFFAANDGLWGQQLWALPLSGGTACVASDSWLCLSGGRFRVEAAWRDNQGNSGAGHAVTVSGDTGWFWFFGPDNVEVLIKVLDGTGVNGDFWVFYGALSDVAYTLTVTDTLTATTRRYHNIPGELASIADTSAFGPRGALEPAIEPSEAIRGTPLRRSRTAAPEALTGTCQAGATVLCLNQGRFAVNVTWKVPALGPGVGTTVPFTSDTGAFWFFDPANLELVIKVIDGRPVNGKFWVFYGALSNVDYTLAVTDTLTGAAKVYHNVAGTLASVADTSAF